MIIWIGTRAPFRLGNPGVMAFLSSPFLSQNCVPDLDGMDEITVQAWVYPLSHTECEYPSISLTSKRGSAGESDDSWNPHLV